MESRPTTEVVTDWLRSQASKGISRRTLEWNAHYAGRFVTVVTAFPATPEQVEAYLLTCRAGSVRHHAWQNVRQLCKFACKRYDFPNPCEKVQPPPRPPGRIAFLTKTQIRALAQACRTDREKLLIALIIGSGLRIGEVRTLRVENVTPHKFYVTGKTGGRWAPSHPYTWQLAMRYVGNIPTRVWRSGPSRRAHYPEIAGSNPVPATNFLLFPNDHHDTPLDIRRLDDLYRRVANRAGLYGVLAQPHTGRHTFARHYWLETQDVAKVQVALGHRSLSQTLKYTHPQVDDLIDTFAEDSPLNHTGFQAQLPLLGYIEILGRAPVPEEQLIAPTGSTPPAPKLRTRLFALEPDRGIRELARIIGCSPSHLSHLKAHKYGCGPDFVRKVEGAFPLHRDTLWYSDPA